MTLIYIPVSAMIVVLVVTIFLVGSLPVSFMPVVIRTFIFISASVFIIPSFIIMISTLIRTFFVLLIALGVWLFVSIPLSRVILPIIGKSHTRAAKNDNDNNAKDGRDFHCFPPEMLEKDIYGDLHPISWGKSVGPPALTVQGISKTRISALAIFKTTTEVSQSLQKLIKP